MALKDFLRLLQQLLAQIAECGNPAGALRILIHQSGTAVNDGLVLRPHAGLVDLLDEGHDELGFFHDGVLLAVALYHIHGIQTIFATRSHVDHRSIFSAQRLTQRSKFVLRIANQNIIVGIVRVQHQKGNQLFGAEGFTGPRYTQQEG